MIIFFYNKLGKEKNLEDWNDDFLKNNPNLSFVVKNGKRIFEKLVSTLRLEIDS